MWKCEGFRIDKTTSEKKKKLEDLTLPHLKVYDKAAVVKMV